MRAEAQTILGRPFPQRSNSGKSACGERSVSPAACPWEWLFYYHFVSWQLVWLLTIIFLLLIFFRVPAPNLHSLQYCGSKGLHTSNVAPDRYAAAHRAPCGNDWSDKFCWFSFVLFIKFSNNTVWKKRPYIFRVEALPSKYY